MERVIGTVTRGLRCPIIRTNDDLVTIVTDTVLKASEQGKYAIQNRDIVAITESIVARAQGNYATIDQVAKDINQKVEGDTIGVIFPILSRNRFSIMLKAIAKAKKKVIIQLSYPRDEVGNELFPATLMDEVDINPYTDTLNQDQYRDIFGYNVHPFTKVDYVKYYGDIVEEQGSEVTFIFSNNPQAILDYTDTVLVADIHSRNHSKRILNNNGARKVIGLDDILTASIDDSGYNEQYGLLGSNKATEESIKLFPQDPSDLVNKIQQSLLEKTGKLVEVMVYGDGAFKDPQGHIWELADPTVSPAYTIGLEGTPNEIKLKYLADNDFKELSGEQLRKAIEDSITSKKEDLGDSDLSLGTTPRKLVDLIGSLADLTSGSGDKGTPIVYIQGYFDSYIKE